MSSSQEYKLARSLKKFENKNAIKKLISSLEKINTLLLNIPPWDDINLEERSSSKLMSSQ